MIIHSISATNVLKYENLELSDLPKSGVIAISGFNESGKSTIGETICFALFGRTFSINEDEREKIIRWGETDCSVSIVFSNDNFDNGSENQYVITRMLDCDGNHSVKLCKENDTDNPLARGTERVEEALFELTSMEYEEFIESFYLAQREITTPHPHSYALKAMAGIATMEHCNANIHDDIDKEVEVLEELQSRTAQLHEEVEELGLDDKHLDSLISEHDQALKDKEKKDESLANYQTNVEEFQEVAPNLCNYLAKVGRDSFWRKLYFMIALASFSLWWVLVKKPNEAIYQKVSSFLDTSLLKLNLPQMTIEHYPYLLYLAGVAIFLYFLFWLITLSHKGTIKRLSETGIDLAQKMQTLDSLRDTEINEQRRSVINKIKNSQISKKEFLQGTESDVAFLIQEQKDQNERIDTLSTAMIIERDRISRTGKLQEKISELKIQITEKESRNKVRELASDLLMGVNRHLSKRFNLNIREYVGKTLPLFTENRYEHLQIDENLTVRVFSNDKHDFMELDEISSGTQRQIMLAVRLALSQEMVKRKVRSSQFMILDEPFAFFDEERTEKSLAILPQLSNDLPQIWIIAQTFPDNIDFARSIYCDRQTVSKTA